MGIQINGVCTHGKVTLKENFLPKKCLRTLAVIFEHLLIQLQNVIIPLMIRGYVHKSEYEIF